MRSRFVLHLLNRRSKEADCFLTVSETSKDGHLNLHTLFNLTVFELGADLKRPDVAAVRTGYPTPACDGQRASKLKQAVAVSECWLEGSDRVLQTGT